MDSNTLWTIGTGVMVILSVAVAAVAVISVVSRLIVGARADMRRDPRRRTRPHDRGMEILATAAIGVYC